MKRRSAGRCAAHQGSRERSARRPCCCCGLLLAAAAAARQEESVGWVCVCVYVCVGVRKGGRRPVGRPATGTRRARARLHAVRRTRKRGETATVAREGRASSLRRARPSRPRRRLPPGPRARPGAARCFTRRWASTISHRGVERPALRPRTTLVPDGPRSSPPPRAPAAGSDRPSQRPFSIWGKTPGPWRGRPRFLLRSHAPAPVPGRRPPRGAPTSTAFDSVGAAAPPRAQPPRHAAAAAATSVIGRAPAPVSPHHRCRHGRRGATTDWMRINGARAQAGDAAGALGRNTPGGPLTCPWP